MNRIAIPLIALCAATAPLQAAEIQISSPGPVVELNVSEVVRSAPDVAQIGAGVTTRAETAQEAMRLNAQQMDRLIARIKALGIDAKDIQTANLSLNAQYRYNNDGGQPTFLGYEVSNQLNVKLRDLKRAGEALDALVSAGANNLYGPNFMLEDDATAKAQARKAAFQHGQAMAEDYARMAGYSGVRLLEVSESFQNIGPMPLERGVMAAAAPPADAKTQVEPGEVGTGVNITVKYEMTR